MYYTIFFNNATLQGHLFDTGLINQVLDLLERHGDNVEFNVVNCDVRPNNSGGAQFSRVRFDLKSPNKAALQAVMTEITAAVEKTPKAEGVINVTEDVRIRPKQLVFGLILHIFKCG